MPTSSSIFDSQSCPELWASSNSSTIVQVFWSRYWFPVRLLLHWAGTPWPCTPDSPILGAVVSLVSLLLLQIEEGLWIFQSAQLFTCCQDVVVTSKPPTCRTNSRKWQTQVFPQKICPLDALGLHSQSCLCSTQNPQERTQIVRGESHAWWWLHGNQLYFQLTFPVKQ